MAIKIQGIAGQGGANVITAGIPSTSESLFTFPGCTVTVYQAGTLTLASIWQDAAGTVPKANPFTTGADASWFFYATVGESFDVHFSGTGIDTPFTLGDVPAVGATSGGSGVSSVFGRTGAVVSQTNDYTWAQINKTTSSLADITTRSASDLSSGTLPDARFPATLPALNGSLLTNLSATAISTGTLPVARGGTGTGTAFTPGSLVFAGGSGIYNQDNAQLFWDDSNNRLGVGTATPGQKLEVSGGDVFVNNATASLYLKDTSTGLQAATTTVLTPLNNNSIRSTNFTSGLVGWSVAASGNAEFANVDVRGAIRSSVFLYNALQATAGTFGVFKSAAKLRSDVTVTAAPTYGTTTFTIDAVDQDGLSHGASQLFVVNDILRLKEGLTGDTWFKVTAVSDQTTFWRYTAAIMAGSSNVTYRAGLGIADYGQSGQGFIIDTADAANSPYTQMATHAGTFSSLDAAGTLNVTPRIRMGNLNGSYGFATNTYGFGAGEYGSASASWVTVDATNGVRIGNNTTTKISLDTSGNASFSGSITASSGTIAGWTINSNRLSSSSVHIASGFDVPSGAVGWFGRQSGGSHGWFLRDSSGRYVASLAGATSPSFPYLAINDGSFFRVVLGGLNDTFNGGASVSSMGLKIWNSSGALLAEFSDSANSIAGWTISSTKISSTGVDITSGSTASIAFGTTPPTGPSSGTGVYVDKTGFFSLNAGTQDVKIDATNGVLSVGNGKVLFYSAGIKFTSGSPSTNVIGWGSDSGASNQQAQINASTSGGTRSLDLNANPINDGTLGRIQLFAENGSSDAGLVMAVQSSGNSSGNSSVRLYVTGGATDAAMVIGSSGAPTASTILDLTSTTGALLLPRMTSTQRDALTATNGMVIYNSTIPAVQAYVGGSWTSL